VVRELSPPAPLWAEQSGYPEWLVERGVFVVEVDLGHPEAVAPLERSRQAIPLLTYEAGA
jgi:hypothetical protein